MSFDFEEPDAAREARTELARLARSWLLVPPTDLARLHTAVATSPDCLVLDLEDGVPTGRKHLHGQLRRSGFATESVGSESTTLRPVNLHSTWKYSAIPRALPELFLRKPRVRKTSTSCLPHSPMSRSSLWSKLLPRFVRPTVSLNAHRSCAWPSASETSAATSTSMGHQKAWRMPARPSSSPARRRKSQRLSTARPLRMIGIPSQPTSTQPKSSA